jgi:hypothetical protein
MANSFRAVLPVRIATGVAELETCCRAYKLKLIYDVPCLRSPVGTEENDEESRSGEQGSGPRFQLRDSGGKRIRSATFGAMVSL